MPDHNIHLPFESQISSLIEMLNSGLEIATETFFANPHLTFFCQPPLKAFYFQDSQKIGSYAHSLE